MTDAKKDIRKAFTAMPTQDEANYIPLSATQGKACANCRWFIADFQQCFIIDNHPEPILATGYCDRWEATPEPATPMEEVITEAVVEAVETIAETVADMPVAYVEMSTDKPKHKPFMERVRDFFRPQDKDESFTVFKGSDDKWHWHAVFTNNFEDREGEILTEKAHDNYIKRLDMHLVPMPVLMGWHTPGTEHGEADVIWRDNHLVHAVGHFYDTPMAEKAIKFYQKNIGKIKMSHGFVAPEWAFDGKHYDDYNTIEITTLPPYAAANPYTSFEELVKMSKERSEEKSRYLEQLVGKENLATIDAKSGEINKGLEEMGVKHKDHSQVTPEPAKADSTEANKAVSELFVDIVTMQSEMLELQKAHAKALKDKDTEIAALKTDNQSKLDAMQKQLDDLGKIVNAPPRRPSQDVTTVIPTNSTLKDQTPKTPDTFFGDLFGSNKTAPNGAKQ